MTGMTPQDIMRLGGAWGTEVHILPPHLLPRHRVQYRFPRSKSRRIRKRWAKRRRNYRMEADQMAAYYVHDALYVGPAMYAAIRRNAALRG